MREIDLGSTELSATVPTGSTAYGYETEDMIIYDNASWGVYVNRVRDSVSKGLGDEGFPVLCRLLENERSGRITKGTLIQLFSEVIGVRQK